MDTHICMYSSSRYTFIFIKTFNIQNTELSNPRGITLKILSHYSLAISRDVLKFKKL